MTKNKHTLIVTETSGGNDCNRCVDCEIKEIHILRLKHLLKTLEDLLETFEERRQISADLLEVDRREKGLRYDESDDRYFLSEDYYYKHQKSQEGPPF